MKRKWIETPFFKKSTRDVKVKARKKLAYRKERTKMERQSTKDCE